MLERKVASTLTVLLVEDSSTARTYALQTLRGHNNIIAINAKEAMEKFKLNKVDIVFLDINLPDGNGLDLLQEMKKQKPDCFIVMMTGSGAKDDINKAKEYGAAGYILKPFNTKKIQDMVDMFVTSRKAAQSGAR